MTRVTPLKKDKASPEVQEIYAEMESSFGVVPNVFQTAGHYPPLLKTNWEKTKTIMLNQGALSRKVKETIAVLVSRDNACQYCVGAHSMMLKVIGVTDQELENIHDDALEQAGFHPKEILLISLARAANSDPRNIPESLFDELNSAEVTEAEIVEALAVMELFISLNKFVDALGIILEEDAAEFSRKFPVNNS